MEFLLEYLSMPPIKKHFNYFKIKTTSGYVKIKNDRDTRTLIKLYFDKKCPELHTEIINNVLIIKKMDKGKIYNELTLKISSEDKLEILDLWKKRIEQFSNAIDIKEIDAVIKISMESSLTFSNFLCELAFLELLIEDYYRKRDCLLIKQRFRIKKFYEYRQFYQKLIKAFEIDSLLDLLLIFHEYIINGSSFVFPIQLYTLNEFKNQIQQIFVISNIRHQNLPKKFSNSWEMLNFIQLGLLLGILGIRRNKITLIIDKKKAVDKKTFNVVNFIFGFYLGKRVEKAIQKIKLLPELSKNHTLNTLELWRLSFNLVYQDQDGIQIKAGMVRKVIKEDFPGKEYDDTYFYLDKLLSTLEKQKEFLILGILYGKELKKLSREKEIDKLRQLQEKHFPNRTPIENEELASMILKFLFNIIAIKDISIQEDKFSLLKKCILDELLKIFNGAYSKEIDEKIVKIVEELINYLYLNKLTNRPALCEKELHSWLKFEDNIEQVLNTYSSANFLLKRLTDRIVTKSIVTEYFWQKKLFTELLGVDLPNEIDNLTREMLLKIEYSSEDYLLDCYPQFINNSNYFKSIDLPGKIVDQFKKGNSDIVITLILDGGGYDVYTNSLKEIGEDLSFLILENMLKSEKKSIFRSLKCKVTPCISILPSYTLPSHLSMLSGQYPLNHQIYGNNVFDRNLNLCTGLNYKSHVNFPNFPENMLEKLLKKENIEYRYITTYYNSRLSAFLGGNDSNIIKSKKIEVIEKILHYIKESINSDTKICILAQISADIMAKVRNKETIQNELELAIKRLINWIKMIYNSIDDDTNLSILIISDHGLKFLINDIKYLDNITNKYEIHREVGEKGRKNNLEFLVKKSGKKLFAAYPLKPSRFKHLFIIEPSSETNSLIADIKEDKESIYVVSDNNCEDYLMYEQKFKRKIYGGHKLPDLTLFGKCCLISFYQQFTQMTREEISSIRSLHGGCSFEEVFVPLIELKKLGE
ncbi:MAG: alkaline phosphatase family protein [Promethearchaeota archaeon]|jgi:hypothetical protein